MARLEIGDGLGLLLEDQHPVAVLERGRCPVGLVVVVERLGRGRERAAIFAAGAGIGLDEVAHRAALEHRPGLVDQQQLPDRPRAAGHRLAGHEHDRREHDAAQFFAGRQVGHLEHGEIMVEIEARLAFEKPAVSAARHVRCQRGRKVARHVGQLAGQRLADIGDRGRGALLGPDLVDDRGRSSPRSASLRRAECRAIWPDDRLDHAEAVEPVVLVLGGARRIDHRERVEAEARTERELDKAARPGA